MFFFKSQFPFPLAFSGINEVVAFIGELLFALGTLRIFLEENAPVAIPPPSTTPPRGGLAE